MRWRDHQDLIACRFHRMQPYKQTNWREIPKLVVGICVFAHCYLRSHGLGTLLSQRQAIAHEGATLPHRSKEAHGLAKSPLVRVGRPRVLNTCGKSAVDGNDAAADARSSAVRFAASSLKRFNSRFMCEAWFFSPPCAASLRWSAMYCALRGRFVFGEGFVSRSVT